MTDFSKKMNFEKWIKIHAICEKLNPYPGYWTSNWVNEQTMMRKTLCHLRDMGSCSKLRLWIVFGPGMFDKLAKAGALVPQKGVFGWFFFKLDDDLAEFF